MRLAHALVIRVNVFSVKPSPARAGAFSTSHRGDNGRTSSNRCDEQRSLCRFSACLGRRGNSTAPVAAARLRSGR